VLSALSAPGAALAGGYDTPILYSARHQGMGGAAIAFVDDASAVFHNPAGLSRVRGVNLLGNFSLLLGSITSSPGSPDLPNAAGTYPARTSQRVVAPLFLLAAAARLGERIGVGLAVFPVASAAGEYRNTNIIGNSTIDKTRLVFIEVAPAISVRLLPRLSLAASYRVTHATLERVKGDLANPREFDFSMAGTDFAGLRLGLQWQAAEWLSVGAVYRNKISPTLSAPRALAYSDLTDANTTLVLPAKLGGGAAFGWHRLRVAVDLEYGFFSQNDRTTLSGFNPALNKTESVTNRFGWQDGITARFGGEYGLGQGNFVARAGYIYDGKVSNKAFPSAFGTPPDASHTLSVGTGYRTDRWQANVAAVYRFVATAVTPADVAGAMDCATCSKPGPDYSLRMLGIYVDLSLTFGAAGGS